MDDVLGTIDAEGAEVLLDKQLPDPASSNVLDKVRDSISNSGLFYAKYNRLRVDSS